MADELETLGQNAKKAATELARLSSKEKNEILARMADSLEKNSKKIVEANKKDLKASDLRTALRDRLMLDEARIKSIASDVREIINLADPVGEEIGKDTRPNGIHISKVRVPIGVIGIIYESRPNVTVDASVLCFKAGNAVILRGGSEAINSNIALVEVMQVAGLPKGAIQLLRDTSRETATKLMRLNKYLDCLIPRGGAGLIQAVIQNASVPAIETGIGNCHLYIDSEADLQMAEEIAINAKCQRPGVCNAIEKIVVHEKVAKDFIPRAVKALGERGVEIKGDEKARAIAKSITPATEEDWYTEYLDLIIAIKVVSSLDEAISHINKYGSHHSDAIITKNKASADRFLKEVDSAAVYHNASTRFTDGNQFGLGAEIGISTQKLHARGPMGLRELTSYKYVVNGTGQIRK
ncbi:Alpha-ketoglutarate semialdehyde dehydrogenase [Candidatus Gugararchaeum adminiculabundum]|nr:Alpha-ketoglutarate semialdehyde dehydrogenase [Candidatus Gugararchaeum adminiculabundum]